MEKSKRHVQLPNNMTTHEELSPKDLMVYVTLKRHMNKNTKESFPSLECISKECDYSIPPIRKSIKILEEKGYITIRKEGRKNIYGFNPHKNFEPFSYDFLDKKEVMTNEKAYIIAAQQFMIKDAEGLGKVSYSNEELGKLLNISAKTISRLDKDLVDKGFLTIIKTNKKDPITGVKINEKIFHLDELGQAIIWTLQKHDEDIEDLKIKTDTNSKDIKIVLNENKELKKEIEELKRLILGSSINEITL